MSDCAILVVASSLSSKVLLEDSFEVRAILVDEATKAMELIVNQKALVDLVVAVDSPPELHVQVVEVLNSLILGLDSLEVEWLLLIEGHLALLEHGEILAFVDTFTLMFPK